MTAFSDADTVGILEIFGSAREEKDPSISGRILADAISTYHKDVFFLEQTADVVDYLRSTQFSRDTVLVCMGAGDIYKIIDQLVIQKDE